MTFYFKSSIHLQINQTCRNRLWNNDLYLLCPKIVGQMSIPSIGYPICPRWQYRSWQKIAIIVEWYYVKILTFGTILYHAINQTFVGWRDLSFPPKESSIKTAVLWRGVVDLVQGRLKICPMDGVLERWQSGLMRGFAKSVNLYEFRRFESCPLRFVAVMPSLGRVSVRFLVLPLLAVKYCTCKGLGTLSSLLCQKRYSPLYRRVLCRFLCRPKKGIRYRFFRLCAKFVEVAIASLQNKHFRLSHQQI